MRLPTLFVSHGSPMCALRTNPFAERWAALARELPRPHAILVASAHWETELPMVATAERPPTLHDFGGFPPALERIRYPAPGAPEMARTALSLLAAAGLPASANGCRGLDHGTWVPLLHMFPQADVPVFQVSIQPSIGPGHHLRLGSVLAPLASDGVLIIGSGSITHNLRDWNGWSGEHGPHPDPEAPTYVQEFRDSIEAALRAGDREFLVNYRERAPHAQRAHPTEEHLLPLHVAYAAAGSGPGVERMDLGVDGGAIGMDVFIFRPMAR
ncbi:MAG TPA: class III extradiol ring-cleavage dioxygenase [Burkholderiaceae bacterium]